MEVGDAAGRDVERRAVARDHAAVEDHRRVGAPLVRRQEVDDRVPARLLFAVAGEAHIDRELAGLSELARGAEQHVQLPLVVGDAAAVEVLAADLRLERRRFPQVERIGRLHVEVAVAQHGRRALGVARRADLADRERRSVPVDQTALTAGAANQITHPLAGLRHVRRTRRVGADRLDPHELGKLVKPGRHRRRAYRVDSVDRRNERLLFDRRPDVSVLGAGGELERRWRHVFVGNQRQQVGDAVQPRAALVVSLNDEPRREL
jgi:hypothetical protein